MPALPRWLRFMPAANRSGNGALLVDVPNRGRVYAEVLFARREVPTSCAQSIHGKRTRPPAGHRDKVGSRSRLFSTPEFNE